MVRKKKFEDTELEKDIIEIKELLKKIKEEELKEIEEILKKLQEDTNKPENNLSYYSVKDYGPVANNYLHSTQACSEEEISRQLNFNYNK